MVGRGEREREPMSRLKKKICILWFVQQGAKNVSEILAITDWRFEFILENKIQN